MKINPPKEIDRHLEAPKHLFPYNEEWLECGLTYMFEKRGDFVALEPKIPVLQWKYLMYEYSTKIKPDIVLPERRIIIEVENFHKIPITNIFKQAYDYERETGLITFVATWKTSELKRHLNDKYGDWRIGDRLVLINPLTGEIEASDLFYETVEHSGPEPEYDVQIEYPIKGSPNHHRRIQYELFVFLFGKGDKASLEIPISMNGKVYAPDKIVLDEENGIVVWSPIGWWPYALDQKPADAQIDVISMNSQGVIRGYEVKTAKELAELEDEKVLSRLARELGVMRKSKLFNEVFLCVPTLNIGKVTAEVLEEWKSPVGVIALIEPYRFEIFKHPEQIADIEYKTLDINIIKTHSL